MKTERPLLTRTLPLLAAVALCTTAGAQDAAQEQLRAERKAEAMSSAEISTKAILRGTSARNLRAQWSQIGGCTSYSTDFEAPVFTPGPINGQGGWTVNAAGLVGVSITDTNPIDGSQSVLSGNAAGSPQGTSVGTWSPQCLPGSNSGSIDISISAAGGADYHILFQAPTQGFLSVRVNFNWQNNIMILDEVGGVLQYVDSGADWTAGAVHNFAAALNHEMGLINYYLDGQHFYTGQMFAGTVFEETVLINDNFHIGETGLFDNLELPAALIPSAPPCPADLDGNGTVGVGDLLVLLQSWGPCPGCVPDFDGNDAVGVGDMLILLQAWGACPGGAAPVAGACCFGDGSCSSLLPNDCDAQGGTYGGPHTTCAVFPCPQPEDGETCDLAITVAAPDSVNVNTTGYPVGNTPLCGSAPIADTGTAWFRVTGNGATLTASTCNSGMDETSIAVFCNSCATLNCIAGVNGQDATCPSFSFHSEVSWCADDGVDYYIAVWGTGFDQEGDITLDLTEGGACAPTGTDCGQIEEAVCTLPVENCQLSAGGTYVTTDQDAAFKAADNFNASTTGQITSLCWEGAELNFAGGFGLCSQNLGQGNPYRVTYYADGGGIPGAQLAQFTAVPDSARIGFIGFGFGNAGRLQFTMDHAPVNVVEGDCYWVEVVQMSDPGDCYFLWSPSADGDGLAYQTDLGASYEYSDVLDVTNNDRTFCVSIELGDAAECPVVVEGACCFGVGGCNDGMLAQECRDEFGQFFLGQTCSEVTCPNPCPGSLYVQDWEGFGTGGTSDTNLDLRRWENIPSLGGVNVNTITVWGINGEFDGTSYVSCSPGTQQFNIAIHEVDINGDIGAEICSYANVIATVTDTGVPFGTIGNVFRFQLTLPSACNIDEAWIAVQRNSTNACSFLWTDSLAGDGFSALEDQDPKTPGVTAETLNLSICVN